MIKFYKRKKEKFLNSIQNWIDKELATEYPFIWRREWVTQIALHIDYFLVSILTIFLIYLFDVIWGVGYIDILSITLLSIFLIVVAFLLTAITADDDEVDVLFTPKLPDTGYYDYKEELLVAILNIISKSFLFIYPLLLFYSLVSFSNEYDLDSIKQEIAEYTVNSYLYLEENDSTDAYDLATFDSLIYNNLNLSLQDKKDIISEVQGSLKIVSDFDSIPFSMKLSENLHNLGAPRLKFLSFNNKIESEIISTQNNRKTGPKIILAIYFIMCLVSYLERDYFVELAESYIFPFLRYFIKYVGIPILILLLPFLIIWIAWVTGYVTAVEFDQFTQELYVNIYEMPLNFLTKIFSFLWSSLIKYMTYIFLALSLFFVFFKKRLIELYVEPR